MALLKDKEHPTGATASYWIISRINIDKTGESAELFWKGYASKQFRQDHPQAAALFVESARIPCETFREMYVDVVSGGANMFVLLYTWMQQNVDFFAGAESDHQDIA